jgi:hypothetical protein
VAGGLVGGVIEGPVEAAETAVAATGARVLGLLEELDGIHADLAHLVRRRVTGTWDALELDRYHDLARAEIVARRRLVVTRERFDTARRRAAAARARPRPPA